MNKLSDFINWLNIRDSPNYEGYDLGKDISTEYNSNQDTGTKYSKLNSFKDHLGNSLKDPSLIKDPIYGSKKYVLDCGYNLSDLEGGSDPDHLKIHNYVCDLFKKNTGSYPINICEIGFNAGVSASNFLNNLKLNNNNDLNYLVVSFDLGFHSYCFYAKLWIDSEYKFHHILINGSSFRTVPTFSTFSEIKFDVIFIDGDHTLFGAYWDIINCKKLAHKDTILIVDNVVPHRGVGQEVYWAMLRALKENEINFLEHYKVNQYGEDYHDGCAICTYNFDGINKSNLIDFKEIEKKVTSYSINKILLDNKLDENDFSKLVEIIKTHNNEISFWTFNKIFSYIILNKINKTDFIDLLKLINDHKKNLDKKTIILFNNNIKKLENIYKIKLNRIPTS